jgi:hydroxypyruvate reductase
VRALVISDVIDNDLAVIGSGPLVGGAVAPETVARVLSRPDLVSALPAAVTTALGAPPPPALTPIPHTVVADRTMAVQAALDAARAEGIRVKHHRAPLDGEAITAAEELGGWLEGELRDHRLRGGDETGLWITPVPRARVLHAWSGELTVRLPTDHGTGGRAQQFALAMARELDRATDRLGFPADVLLLAAGTDGRDGPTDAAGAVVSHRTAPALRAAGIDLDATLARCDAHPALDAVDALLRTGSTGTNVADLVLALCWNWY